MRILFLLFVFTVASYGSKAQQKAEWKEIKAFHAIMSKTFHPVEENNFQPLKNNAASLLNAAKAWNKSDVPEGYNKKIIKPVLKRLVAECKELNKAVKDGKSDAELKQLITKAHDTFHELTEKCNGGEEEHKQH